jgi:hypothetical protein
LRIGGIGIYPIADGTFRAGPGYFGDHVTAHGHEDYFSRDGKAWLPIGTFLIRTGDRRILVDAGIGPAMRDDGERRLLVGGQHRALLLGDAIVCPIQLDEPSWQSIGDVDPVLAAKVRERLFRELGDGSTYGVGAHFPELRFGRVLSGNLCRWIG